MMCKDRLEECRKGKEFIDYAKTHGAREIRPGKGDHFIVYGEKGQCVVPVSHELGKGLRHVVIKTFIAIGISAWLIFYVLHLMWIL
jgi:hypothetical protein